MSGIRETIDLDITAALRRVHELEAQVKSATTVNLNVRSEGLQSASGGLTKLTSDARAAEVAVGGISTKSSGLRDELHTLGSTAGLSHVEGDAKSAEKAVGGLHSIVSQARTTFGGLASDAVSSVSPALGGITKGAGEVGAAFGGMSTAALGVAAAGVAVVGVLADMTLHGVADVVRLADQVRGLQRVTGASAEDASKLNAIFGATGVNADAGGQAVFRLSRNIAQHSTTLQADGIEIARNRDHEVDLIGTLENVAVAYKKAGQGAAGNKILFDAFGRSGLALAPILAADKVQLEEFVKAAEKHHEILTQSDVDKARAYQIATHELSESFSGLERELGMAAIPALTGFANAVTGVIEGLDKGAKAVAPFTERFGGTGRVFGGLAEDLLQLNPAVRGVSIVVDVLRGHFRGAVEDAVPFGHTLANLFGHHNKAKEAAQAHAEAELRVAKNLDALKPRVESTSGVLSNYGARVKQLAGDMGIDLANATDKQKEALYKQVAALYEAITPTDRLAEVARTLGNVFATDKEKVDAFRTALDATLDVNIAATEATIKVRTAVDDLTDALKKGKDAHETQQQFQDRITLATDNVTKSVEDEVAALTKSGQVSTNVSAQKEALTSRLLHLADTIGGPVADQLRQHAYRIASIPDEKVTKIDADTSLVTLKLSQLKDAAKKAGEDTIEQYAAGIAQGFRTNEGTIVTSADSAAHRIDTTVRKRLGISSPSKAGIEIGGYFVQGIALGMKQQDQLAYDAAFASAHGLTQVWSDASQITTDEALSIFDALDKVRDSQAKLTWIQHDSKSTAEQLKRATLELSKSQADLNDVTFHAVDSSDALTAAWKNQQAARDALNASIKSGFDTGVGAVDAVVGVRSATAAVATAQQQLDADRRRQAALPQLIQDAQSALQTAQENDRFTGNDTAAQAQDKLTSLLDEQSKSAQKLSDDTDAVTSAQLNLVQAEERLVEAGTALTGTQADVDAYFRGLALNAGLTADQVDNLVATLNRARVVATNAAGNLLPSSGITPTYTPNVPIAASQSGGGAATSTVGASTIGRDDWLAQLAAVVKRASPTITFEAVTDPAEAAQLTTLALRL